MEFVQIDLGICTDDGNERGLAGRQVQLGHLRSQDREVEGCDRPHALRRDRRGYVQHRHGACQVPGHRLLTLHEVDTRQKIGKENLTLFYILQC